MCNIDKFNWEVCKVDRCHSVVGPVIEFSF
jgi:hypothetical protein